MNYRLHRAALAEHLDELAFYEARQPGLGAAYLADFDALMSRICATPELYSRIEGADLRKAGFRHFPFDVIYRVVGGQVVVFAIAHQRRRPTYWLGRAGR